MTAAETEKSAVILGIGFSGEQWKEVFGYPGYFVSTLGRIVSLRRKTPFVMNPEIDKDGYSRVNIRCNDGKSTHKVLSRIVCEAFNGPSPTPEHVCCHNDNNKSNNRPENLRWDVQKGNIADKLAHGTHQIGSNHPRAEITESDALAVKKSLKSYVGTRGRLLNAAKETGVPYWIVADISRGRSWGHV